MKNVIFILFIFCMFILNAHAQPPTCSPPALMTPVCSAACIICDIDGYSGQNNSTVSGVAPPDFCTFIQHNIQWIGFIATSVNLTLEISVSNCNGGSGLEVAIYESFDCANFTMVSNCLGGANGMFIQNGASGSISNTVPLVIGQYYYFVMDGAMGAVCDYSVAVTQGSTQVPALSPINNIYGNLSTCPGGTVTYSIDPIIGAPNVNWIVNGAPVAMGNPVDITFFASGTAQLCVEASNICSPPVTACTTVQVNPIPPTDQFETICLGDCFTLNNTNYCAPGIFPVIFTSYQGCDSLVNLNIEAVPPITTILNEEICDGEVVEVGGEIFNTTGIHEVGLVNYQDCDSTVILVLDVLPNPEIHITEEICEGEFYEVGNESFGQTGMYQVSFLSFNNCDSTVFLDLTVLAMQESFLTESVCDGETFELGNEIFDQTGSYQVGFMDENGCDSLVNLDLTIMTMSESFLTESICQGSTYQIGDDIFEEEGNYQIILEDQHGCDSLVNLELNILVPPETFLSESICEGESYQVGDENFENAGNYEVTFNDQNGCDSLVFLDLNVILPIEMPLNQSICIGDSFEVGNDIFDQMGQYEIAFIAASGCDSIVLLDLQVLQFLETNLTEEICDGEVFEVGNEVFEQGGNYEVQLTANSGCDSIIKLDLTVNFLPETNLTDMICEGDSVQIGNQFFKENGQFEVILSAVTGCDSTVRLDLEVIQPKETYLTETICEGETFSVGNQILDVAGQFDFQLTAASNCDSLVFLELTVLPDLNENLTESICENENYVVGNQSFNQTGQYQIPLIASTGCDSLVNLNLTVFENKSTTINEVICEGESIEIGGQFFQIEGQFIIPLNAATGCDSTITLNLTIHENPEYFLAESICEGETVTIGTQVFNQTGEYQIPFLSAENCDSIVYLNLEVFPVHQTVLFENICENESYSVGNELFNQTGQYQAMLTTFNGCDSLVELDLTVFENKFTILDEEICENETLEVGGQTFNLEGQYSIPLIAATGCDSMVTLNLVVNETPELFVTETICDGETVIIGTQVFDQTGQYQIPFLSTQNCDSTVYLDLEIFPIEQTNLIENICENESYSVGNQTFNQTGQFQVLLTTFDGCDSLVALDLQVINFDTTNLAKEICKGEIFEIGAQPFDQTGQFQVILTTVTGCDSIVNLDLTVMPCEVLANIDEDNLECFGDADGVLSFTVTEGTPPFNYIWQNTDFGTPSGMGILNNLNETENLQNLTGGNYEVIITDVNGFVQTLNALVYEPTELESSLEASHFGDFNLPCHGDEVGSLNTIVFGGTPPFNFLWNTGTQTPNLQNIGAGNYEVTITDQNGCQKVLNQTLSEPPRLEFEAFFDEPDCINELGFIEIQNTQGGVPPYQFQLNDGDFSDNLLFENLPDGNYDVVVQDGNNCEDKVQLFLPPIPILSAELGNDLTIDLGDSIQLNPSFNFQPDSLIWEGNAISCKHCPRPFGKPQSNSLYTLVAVDENGCTITDDIRILVRKKRRVYIPNVFSPNNDGINDVFMIYGGIGVRRVRAFRIFSRWGESVFEAFNFRPNIPKFGWDGTYRAENSNSGVYVWFAEVEFLDGEIILYEGDVMILR